MLTAAFVAPNQLDAEKEATWTNMTDGWEWALAGFFILDFIRLHIIRFILYGPYDMADIIWTNCCVIQGRMKFWKLRTTDKDYCIYHILQRLHMNFLKSKQLNS